MLVLLNKIVEVKSNYTLKEFLNVQQCLSITYYTTSKQE